MTAGMPAWPNGAKVAVSLTFDVDAESGFLGDGPEYARRLTTLSEGRFGVNRGVPRILALLAEHGIAGTFFVPGWTAEHHDGLVSSIVAGGHEVGHHGYLHLRTDKITADEQREEIERGLAALAAAGAPRPVGYRSPAWEMTDETFDLLAEHGFAYDSSCMADDRPYLAVLGRRFDPGAARALVARRLAAVRLTIDHGGNVAHPDELFASWSASTARPARRGGT